MQIIDRNDKYILLFIVCKILCVVIFDVVVNAISYLILKLKNETRM